MVINMKKIYSDHEMKEILGSSSINNQTVDTRIAETLMEIRDRNPADKRKKPGRVWKKIVYGFGTAAAVLLLSFGLCVTNPSLAASIPILGSIFAKVQEVFPFGKIPEDESKKLYIENAQDPNYACPEEDSGFLVTFTEYYASNQAIYFGVQIKSEEKFPQFATMGDTGYQLLQARTDEKYSFREDIVGGIRNIEGRMEDDHTFVGVMRIDYDEIKVDGRKYEKACREAEAKGEPMPDVTAQNRDQWYDEYVIPNEFHLDMTIKWLKGYCVQEEDEGYRKQGEWNYSFDLSQSSQNVRTIQVEEINEQGIGVDYIEISSVELTIHTIEPADLLTFAVVLDRDGKMLLSGSNNAYELAIAGHDISTITVYICDYDEYMDEIKAYALRDDNENFRRILEERALFKKVINT